MISIIIPCFNSEKVISRSIQSIINQTYSNWELILVNNNSTDLTQQILERFRNEFPEKIQVLQELRKGTPFARNTGLRESSGDVIQFLDADDEILPDKFERQLGIMNDQNADIVFGAYSYVTSAKTKTVNPFEADVWFGLIKSRLGITSSNLWRRSKLLEVEGWNENRSSSQEYDLIFRLLQCGASYVFDSEVSAIIYNMGTSVSQSVNKQRIIEILNNSVELRLAIKKYMIDHGKVDDKMAVKIDSAIYDILIGRRDLVPQFINRKLKELALNVPWKLKIRRDIEFLVRQYRRKKR